MAQRISGLYGAVRQPLLYRGLMYALGADNAIRRYLTEVLEPRPGTRMLDVGCGPANILAYLPSLDYTGIDINPKHIAFARQIYGNRGRFIVGHAAEDLRQEARSFDLINVSALLHHLSDEEARALFASLKPLLNEGGRIVTIDNVWLPGQRAMVKFVNNLDSGLNIRTPEGYLSLLNDLGFEVQTRIFHDFLRIPYDHFAMIVRDKPESSR